MMDTTHQNSGISEEEKALFRKIISEILLFILNCLRNDEEEIRIEALKVNTLL